jgi:hypothetical protein
MNNVDPDTQRWVLVSLKEEEKKVKWMGRGKGWVGVLACLYKLYCGGTLRVLKPPSRTRLWPDMNADSLLAKNRAASATDSGVKIEPASSRLFSFLMTSSNSSHVRSGFKLLHNKPTKGVCGRSITTNQFRKTKL